MGVSYLVMTLALGGLQSDMSMQQPAAHMSDSRPAESIEVFLASGENPWAIPVPETGHSREKGRPPSPQVEMNRPRYISPEELEKLERRPGEMNSSGARQRPHNTDGSLHDERFRSPVNGDGGYGYRQGGYPPYGTYGYPVYPGMGLPYDPYGGMPYWGVPYEGLLPFMY